MLYLQNILKYIVWLYYIFNLDLSIQSQLTFYYFLKLYYDFNGLWIYNLLKHPGFPFLRNSTYLFWEMDIQLAIYLFFANMNKHLK